MNDQQMTTVNEGQQGITMMTPTGDDYGLVEAQVRAEIAAQHALAVARPRDLDQTRRLLLKDAQRPRFAEIAEYSIPRAGKEIKGPSIRFAESAYRAMGNLSTSVAVLRDSDEARTLRVKVLDLEANTAYAQDIEIRKTMERRQRGSFEVISQRINSSGEPVYLVRAPDGEVLTNQAAQISKAVRTLILRLVPGDIVEEALDACRDTRRNADKADPDAARKRLADAFGGLNVEPSDLARFLGHPIAQCSPAELDKLRGIYSGIKDGQTTWVEVCKSEEKPGDTKVKETQAERLKRAAGGSKPIEPTTPAPDGVLWPEVVK